MTWPWSKPKPTPPPAPTGSPERALRIARAAELWRERSRAVRNGQDRIAYLEEKLVEARGQLEGAKIDEVSARLELEEATRG